MKLIPKLEKLTNVASSRGYIGCSQIGHPCDRYIWLNKYGKMTWEVSLHKQRIFNRGHLEERRILNLIDDLEDIKFQYQVYLSSQSLQGLCDGILEDEDGERYIFELKTMNEAAFKTLKKYGLGKSNAIYWAQCQAYMRLSKGIGSFPFLVDES